MPKNGFSIIEAIVSLGIISLLIISFGKALHAVGTITTISELRTQAISYAQESTELINDIKNDWFACRCASDSCASDTCTRLSDYQTCNLFAVYTSCWTEYPAGLTGHNDFYLNEVSTDEWELAPLNGGVETISTNPTFTRQIIIENVLRDGNGDIASTGTVDYNSKRVTVTVWYEERGNQHEIHLTTLLTAWENL